MNPIDVDAIEVQVEGDVLSKISTRVSEADTILFTFKALTRTPSVEPNVTVRHKVTDGVLRVEINVC